MYTDKGNVLVIALAILLLVSISVVGYFFWQNQQLKPFMQLTSLKQTTQPTKSVDVTSNWKTFKSDKYSFTFNFPPNLAVDLKNVGFISGSDYYAPDTLTF